jgi:hypothetical protein
VPLRITPFESEDGSGVPAANERPRPQDIERLRATGTRLDASIDAPPAVRPATDGRGGARRTRIVLQFPSDPGRILLSGTLANGQWLTNRAAVVDARVGSGHVVMFAIRPFWRWQSQGTYTLGFNAIMNWNDLDAR